MSNQETIEKYLVGEKGYLKSDISNGKVMMMSGKWGSGKTHFWQNVIIPSLNIDDNKIPNHYISLYGKTSIDEIKSEIFLKVFESVDSFDREQKTKNIVKNSVDIVSSLTKSISVFGMSLDLSKITDKSFESIDKILNDEKLKRTEEYLNSGAIICFDDFERKSKEIDLNDLFGFITQLTLNFKCKVVIILNDDVFKGEEKKIFSNVKEKTVSKFLTYQPSIKELFSAIFNKHSINQEFSGVKEHISKYIQEADVLNARIYNQVLDNLYEWLKLYQYSNENERRFLVLANINFILYHGIVKYRDKNCLILKGFYNKGLDYNDNRRYGLGSYEEFNTFEEYIDHCINRISSNDKSPSEEKQEKIQFIKENIEQFKSEFFINKLEITSNLTADKIDRINNFIETGILVNEEE